MKVIYYITIWIPILFTIGLVARCGFLFHGIDVECLRGLFAVPPIGAALFYYLSWWMQFCWVHRSMVCFVGVVNIMTMLQDYNIFDNHLTEIRLILFIVGILLIFLLIIRLYGRKAKISNYCPKSFRFGK